jgi:hypothetical protein
VVVQQAPPLFVSPEKNPPAIKEHQSTHKKTVNNSNTGAIIVNTEERKAKDSDGLEILDAKKLIGSSQAKNLLQKQLSIKPLALQ